MRVAFLMTELNGLGGTARTTLAIAEGLARLGDEVEIISVFNSPTSIDLHIPPRVRVRTLSPHAMTGSKAAPAGGSGPARIFPSKEELFKRFDAGVEALVEEALRGLRADVVIATRTGLAAYLPAFVPDGVVTIAQIHDNPSGHNPKLRAQMRKVYARLDAVETLTEASGRVLAGYAPEIADRIRVLPNAVDDTLVRPVSDGSKSVVAVGRLAPIKQFDLLIEAFASLAGDYPQWRLRIFGRGPEADRLREDVDRRGLGGRVLLPGRVVPAYAEWAKADVGVSSSRVESFGVSIVEGMRMGVPMVVTDVPSGPREIITSGVDGLLVEPDAESIAEGLRTLMADAELRAAIGARAVETAARYTIGEVAGLHRALHMELVGSRADADVQPRLEETRLGVERLSPESLRIEVHGPEREPLVLRSTLTGAEFRPEPEDRGAAADRYRIDRSALDGAARMEDWEVSAPSAYRLDSIAAARPLDAALVSASDLLPQKVKGRLVLRSRRRRRFAEVVSVERIDRRAVRLELRVVGEPMARARLRLMKQGGGRVCRDVRGKRLGESRFRFTLKTSRLRRIAAEPLRLSVRLAGEDPEVTVGSLLDDMYGRRVMGVFALDSRPGPLRFEWGYERSGSMSVELR